MKFKITLNIETEYPMDKTGVNRKKDFGRYINSLIRGYTVQTTQQLYTFTPSNVTIEKIEN